MLLALLCANLAAAQGADPTVDPEVLLRLEQYRSNIRTATIEYSRTFWAGQQKYFRYETCRVAGTDVLRVDRGNEKGFGPTVTGERSASDPVPIRTLRNADQTWEKENEPNLPPGSTGMASAMPADAYRLTPDLRNLGLTTGLSGFDVHTTLFVDRVRQPSPRRYSETVEDGLHVVTIKSDIGTRRLWIDPQRGWCPVRVRAEMPDGVWAEERISIGKFDDIWFPEATEYFVSGWKDGLEPFEVIKIQKAEFNRPEHPQRITPQDIGITKGTTVEVLDDDGRLVRTGFFDGQKVATPEEFRAERDAERAVAAAAAVEGNAAGVSGSVVSDRKAFESAWEKYTREFIARYQLNEEQSQAALRILSDCQKEAQRYVSARSSDFERLEKDTAEAATVSNAGEKKSAIERVATRRAQLVKPIDDIFEKQLKPRLDTLPTRAQRLDAEKANPPGAKHGP